MTDFVKSLSPVTVVCGHYGVGKTNFALNLALDCARSGYRTVLVDLDVVNPYFRTSDYISLLKGEGVEVIAPTFAGTTLDTPSLSGATAQAVEAAYGDPQACRVILDAGGDDAGATALGRFSKAVADGEYTMLYIVNERRNLTQDPEEAVSVLAEIEDASHLSATGIVDNTHLQDETTAELVASSIPFAEKVSDLAGIPLLAVAVPRTLEPCDRVVVCRRAEQAAELGAYMIDVHVRTPWR